MPERGATPNVPVLQRRILRAVGALTSPLLPDDYLELINPLWSTRELRGRIERIDHETADAATVLIKPGYEWHGHKPGQYLRIGLDIEGVRHWRAYSLTSDPERPDGFISITVKNVDEGKVSPYLVRRGRPGTIVGLGGVEGEFVLPEERPAHGRGAWARRPDHPYLHTRARGPDREQIEAIGREFDELHEEVKSDLGERDALYIHGIIDLHRRLGLIGRALLIGSRFRPAWVAGTTTLSLAKILENMEIGHNVLHGQWDWMNHPVINSTAWDWDTASTSQAWKHSHNYVHHTYTNIRGKDKDLGYELMRIDPHQPWHPVYLLQPFYNLLLMGLFEWGVAVHDLDLDAIRAGEKPLSDVRKDLKGMAGKARNQIVPRTTSPGRRSAGS